jgi:hypothetical protein
MGIDRNGGGRHSQRLCSDRGCDRSQERRDMEQLNQQGNRGAGKEPAGELGERDSITREMAQEICTEKRASLCLVFREDINPGDAIAFRSVHRCDCAPVAASLELVEARPMLWKIRRMQQVHVHQRTERIQDQTGKTHCGSPSVRDQFAGHSSALPAASQ